MKPTVDLTLNRQFSDSTSRIRTLSSIEGLITGLPKSPFPWKQSTLNILDYYTKQLFPTGTVQQIKQQQFVLVAVSEKHCDRCGRELFGWSPRGLCITCQQAVEKEFSTRTPWAARN